MDNNNIFTNSHQQICNDFTDTDSDTSSASSYTEEKLNFSEEKNKIISNLISPIKAHPYFDQKLNLLINDSYELSILRFLHIIFDNDGIIHFKNFTKFMNTIKKECNELEDFFINNPGIMSDSDFYSSAAGIKLRHKWYCFLSNKQFFSYVNNTHQLYPNNKNFLQFITEYFPQIIEIQDSSKNEQEIINIIYSKLNFRFTQLSAIFSTYTKFLDDTIHKAFVHNIYIDNIEVFIFESLYIIEKKNLNVLYFTKTEITYS
jgi:hypothetical protein